MTKSKLIVGELIEILLKMDKNSVICTEELYLDDYGVVIDSNYYTVLNVNEKETHYINDNTGLEEFGKIVIFN
jgi:hypothetical protein